MSTASPVADPIPNQCGGSEDKTINVGNVNSLETEPVVSATEDPAPEGGSEPSSASAKVVTYGEEEATESVNSAASSSPECSEAGTDDEGSAKEVISTEEQAAEEKKTEKPTDAAVSAVEEKEPKLETKDSRPTTSSYLDFSRIPASGTNSVASIFKAASAKEPTFPVKLHLILSNPEFEDIVSWMPHGRSWRILRPEVFEDRILPLFFCHCRLSSFMRQVNGWGFRRIKHGPDYNSYYHELFLRGLPHLVERMRRESVTAKSKGAEGEDEPAPDLYKISEENPLPENPPLTEYRRRSAATGAGVGVGTPSAGAMANPMMFHDPMMSSSFGMGGMGAMPSPMPNAMPCAMPPMGRAGGPANQAELLNAFRTARMMEQQRLAAMGTAGPYGGAVGRWGAFNDAMNPNVARGVTMTQMDLQNRMKFGGVPGATVNAEMNHLAYRQVGGGLGQGAGWRADMPSNPYQPDAAAFGGAAGAFAPALPSSQMEFDRSMQLRQFAGAPGAGPVSGGPMSRPGGPAGFGAGSESKYNDYSI